MRGGRERESERESEREKITEGMGVALLADPDPEGKQLVTACSTG